MQAQSDFSKASGEVAAAQAQQSSAKQRIKSAGKALVKIARDILGVDAALDCISSGDVGACGETLLNIAGSFAGGLAGKILAKYGAPWKWAKGARLAKRVAGLVGDLIGGAKGLLQGEQGDGQGEGRARQGRRQIGGRAQEGRGGAQQEQEVRARVPQLPAGYQGSSGWRQHEADREGRSSATRSSRPTRRPARTTVREVAGTIVTEDDKHFSDLTVKTALGKSQALVATTTHPFWVESEQTWIKAGDLEPGMRLHTPMEDMVEVTANRHYDARQRTHDLTVTGIHAYYVLADETPLLVHNCGEIDYGSIGSDERRSGIVAEVTPQMLGAGTKASRSVRPPGFVSGANGDARGHLLPKGLGGSGTTPANIVRTTGDIDNGDMRIFEEQVAAYIDSTQSTIMYAATPQYRAGSNVPFAVSIEAFDDTGWMMARTFFQ